MSDPEAPVTYEQLRAAELMQLAYLAGEFHDALLAARIPSMLAHDLCCAWFDDELCGGEGTVTDD